MNSSNISVPTIGQPLPEFELPIVYPPSAPQVLAGENSTSKAAASTCSAENLRGRAHVLFVYPRDATAGCTLEAQGFRDLYTEFAKLKVEILGLSRDTVGAHRKFIEAQNLPFGLLADKEQNVLKGWNLIVPGTMYGKPVTKVARTTFWIDEKGIVRQIWRDVVPEAHATQVLQTIEQNL